MCCLIGCVSNKLDLEIIRKIWSLNDDGAGVAWFEGKKAKYIKGIETPEKLAEVVKDLPLPHVVHLRLQSTGGFSKLLTHPFEVTRDSKLHLKGEANRLLFHNGTDSDYNKYLSAANLHVKDKSPMSDTRAIAMIVSNNNERFLKVASGKFILMDATCGKFKTFGDFFESDECKGVIFSNLHWKWKTKTHVHQGYSQSSNSVTYSNYHQAPKQITNGNCGDCGDKNEIQDAEILNFENEGNPVNFPSYSQLTYKEKEEHWNRVFNRKKNDANIKISDCIAKTYNDVNKEYWLKLENNGKKQQQKSERSEEEIRQAAEMMMGDICGL